MRSKFDRIFMRLPKQSFIDSGAEIRNNTFNTTGTIIGARSNFYINDHIFHDFLNGSWLLNGVFSWRDTVFIVFTIKIKVIAIGRTSA